MRIVSVIHIRLEYFIYFVMVKNICIMLESIVKWSVNFGLVTFVSKSGICSFAHRIDDDKTPDIIIAMWRTYYKRTHTNSLHMHTYTSINKREIEQRDAHCSVQCSFVSFIFSCADSVHWRNLNIVIKKYE